MDAAFTAEYIRIRMKELGIADYYLRLRHFVLQRNETVNIDADNQFFVLVEPVTQVSIRSDFGVYDLSAFNVNELQYEHQGKITLQNNSAVIQHIEFVQVLPQLKDFKPCL